MTFLLTVKGQEKKDLAISVSTGLLNRPYYDDATAGEFLSLEFNYHLTRRHFLTTNYLMGQHHYYEDVLSNAPTYRSLEDATNTVAGYQTFSVMYKYRVLNDNPFSIVPGGGAVIMTHFQEYPYMERTSYYIRRSGSSS